VSPSEQIPPSECGIHISVIAQEYLTDLFRRHDGNISQDAKTAGTFDRKTLRRLLAKHGIRA
jgi:ActR/RegA family two-component response regulator